MLLATSFLAACATASRLSAVETRPAKIPAVLKQDCALATELPDRPLGKAETARLWARDRQALGDCGKRHRALATAAEALEGQGAAGQ